MAQLFPFRAYRYNQSKSDPARVLTQPYDKITPAMQQRYLAASPYNLVTVEKGPAQENDSTSNNVYTRAAQALTDWIAKQVLMQDPQPSFYAYFQEFQAPGTANQFVRKGLIALGQLVDYSAGVVFRHEQTLSGPKADRLELMRHTRVNTGQLFMLYDDPARRMDAILDGVVKTRADMDMRDEFGVIHYLWRIADPATIAAIQSEMADKKIVIADGHHRYETALAYRDEERAKRGGANPDAPYERAMMTLVNSHDEGLTILPTHRVLSGLAIFDAAELRNCLKGVFEVREVPLTGSASQRGTQAQKALATAGESGRAIGMYAGGDQLTLLSLKSNENLASALSNVSPLQRELDVVLLHNFILEKCLGITPESVRKEANIRYEREASLAISAVSEGRAQASFLLNPVRVEQVIRIALAGEVMPQKSTDFYPKMLSGIAIYRLEP